MTTIAFDGKILAVDSLQTAGNTNFGEIEKLFKLEDGRIFAGSGRTAAIHAVKRWLDGGPKPSFNSEEDFGGIIIFPNGDAIELDAMLEPFPCSVPWALGSGESFALAAMDVGCNAIKAIEIACKRDIKSGGAIKSVEIK